MKLSIKSIVIHPFLFGIFPALFLFSNNLDFLKGEELLFSLVIIVTPIFLIWISLRKILNNSMKAGIVISWGMIFFFSYSSIHGYLDNIEIGEFYIKHTYLIGVFVILFSVGTFFILKIKKDFTKTTTAINIFAIILIAIPLFMIGMSFDQTDDSNILDSAINDSPNIYYIILDAYSNPSVLNSVYNYDNSHFINQLNEKGFYVVQNGNSNYRHGFMSISSSLNMKYINYLADEIGVDSRNFRNIYELVDENEVMSKLKQRGYKIISFASNDGLTGQIELADINLCEKNPFLESQLFIMVIRETILNPFYVKYNDYYSNERTNCVFTELSSMSKKIDEPFFVFAHFLLPHSPFRFDAAGEEIENPPPLIGISESEHKIGYLNQVRFLESKLIEIVNDILDTSKAKPIIIIQSDVGTSLESEDKTENMLRKLKILNAYYLPDNGNSMLYDSITPVNSFRIVFNHYFNDDYDLLEDRIYFSEYNSELNFTEITAQLIGN